MSSRHDCVSGSGIDRNGCTFFWALLGGSSPPTRLCFTAVMEMPALAGAMPIAEQFRTGIKVCTEEHVIRRHESQGHAALQEK